MVASAAWVPSGSSASVGSVSVFLASPTGGFLPPQDYPANDIRDGIALADFNGDGHLDAFGHNRDTRSISIALGDGTGAFASPVSYVVAAYGVRGPSSATSTATGERTPRSPWSIRSRSFSGTVRAVSAPAPPSRSGPGPTTWAPSSEATSGAS